jgi:hypothetical protein
MFGEWAPRYRHSRTYPLCILYIFYYLLHPSTQKNDGGVEMMMTTMMTSEEFWTEAEAEIAGFGVVVPLLSQMAFMN